MALLGCPNAIKHLPVAITYDAEEETRKRFSVARILDSRTLDVSVKVEVEAERGSRIRGPEGDRSDRGNGSSREKQNARVRRPFLEPLPPFRPLSPRMTQRRTRDIPLVNQSSREDRERE
jgi:hypothetical protein